MEFTDIELINIALETTKKAYSPYSEIKVGALLIDKHNNIFKGVNIENASYGLTVCAERTALFNAISQGNLDFKKLVVVGLDKFGDQIKTLAPCGACRQVMAEFMNLNTDILYFVEGKLISKKLETLIPDVFILKNNKI